MALKAPPAGKATWADHVYTCSYQLAVGTLVLSVKESPDVSTARIHLDELRRRLGPSKPLTGIVGLGLPAFESRSGTVLFLKDNATLEVNASALPQRIGPDKMPRGDIAYAVAAGVLACWTE